MKLIMAIALLATAAQAEAEPNLAAILAVTGDYRTILENGEVGLPQVDVAPDETEVVSPTTAACLRSFCRGDEISSLLLRAVGIGIVWQPVSIYLFATADL